MGPFTKEDRKRIKEGIAEKYKKVAVNPEGSFQYPTGRAGLEGQNYDSEIVKALPEEVQASYCGVGNPFSLGPINKSEAVLDVGCGAGVDTLVAAMMTGPEGKAVGVDITPEMLDRARANLKRTSLGNVSFQGGSAEELPFADRTFDVVISNGVFNLVPDKPKALKEIFRVLKPGGRLMMADQILTGEMPSGTEAMVESWAKWQGGAIPGKDFLAMLRKACFTDVELVRETGFNSSPVTKGVLLRAVKPERSTQRKEDALKESPLNVASPGFTWAGGTAQAQCESQTAGEKPEGRKDEGPLTEAASNTAKPGGPTEILQDKVEHLTKRALELGAKKAKIIDTRTIIVEEWVRWKCRYGCPMYEKDAFHPPLAPDTESTRKVIGEYSKALLINGSNGNELSDIALKLEGEAYFMGYYKAFAFAAFATAAGSTWAGGATAAQSELPQAEAKKARVRPIMEACGIDVFRTARVNGFEIDTRKETYGDWNFFALVLVE